MRTIAQNDKRVVAYFSAEFLPGPHLANNLLNLGIFEQTRQAISELGLNLDEIIEQEEEPVLATVVWAVWPHVTWILLPRWKYRLWVMAYAMSSAFSTR